MLEASVDVWGLYVCVTGSLHHHAGFVLHVVRNLFTPRLPRLLLWLQENSESLTNPQRALWIVPGSVAYSLLQCQLMFPLHKAWSLLKVRPLDGNVLSTAQGHLGMSEENSFSVGARYLEMCVLLNVIANCSFGGHSYVRTEFCLLQM